MILYGEVDLPLLRRFELEPDLVGNNWYGFRDPAVIDRRFAENGFLTDDMDRLMVAAGDDIAGFVVYWKQKLAGKAYHWEIGITLLPGGTRKPCSPTTCSSTRRCSGCRPAPSRTTSPSRRLW